MGDHRRRPVGGRYSAGGGLLADAWTDVVQGLAVIVGLVVLAGLLLASGTLQQAWTQVPAARLSLLAGDTPWYVTLEAWAAGAFLLAWPAPYVSALVAAAARYLPAGRLGPRSESVPYRRRSVAQREPTSVSPA